MTAITPDSVKASDALSPEKIQKLVQELTKSMCKNIDAQIVYKRGSTGGKVEAEAPNVSEEVARAFFGEDKFKCTAKTKVVR